MRIAALILLIVTSTVEAQERTGPAAAAAARISGKVMSDTGAPLAGVRLFIALLGEPALNATSDANGVFEFPRVPAGNHRLTASKAGFFLKGRGNGAVGGAMVTVRPGQTVPSMTVAMSRGGAIIGRIVDEFGDPAQQVHVQAFRDSYQPDGSRVSLQSGIADITDDRGEFRVYGLSPGDFIVAATTRTVDPEPAPPAVFNALASAGSAPTYFPGTLKVAEAQTISLGAGQEASVQFALLRGRTFRIAGTVITSTGAAAAARAITLASGNSLRRPLPLAVDGRFTFDGVPPGDYSLDLTGLGPGSESGSLAVTVSDADVTGLVLTTTRGARLRGRVVFEGQPPGVNEAFPLRVVPRERSRIMSFGTVVAARGDGPFEVEGAFGRVDFAVGGKWAIKSVSVGGVDVLDTGIDLAGKDVVSGIRVVVTDRLTSVSGRVATARGEPLEGYDVVLFRLDGVPADASLGVRALRTDAAGHFETRGLRPGTYVAAAVEDLEPGAHFTAEVQERLRMAGQRFSLAEGQAVTLDLEPSPHLP